MRNAGLDEAQARIKIARRNANNLRYADDTTLTAESKDQPRSPTLQVNSLPTEVQGKNFMANRCGNNGNSKDFILGDYKITADGDYSHEIKRCLLFGRKAMINLDSTLKNIDITLQAKVCLVKAMVFPVVMYGCESWTIKKAEPQIIDAFELWC